MEAIASTLDGFKLADLDLVERREGDVSATASPAPDHLAIPVALRPSRSQSDRPRLLRFTYEESPVMAYAPGSSGVARRFLNESYPRFDSEFGVGVCEVRLHGPV